MMLKHWKSLLFLFQISGVLADADVTGNLEKQEDRILQDPSSVQTDLVHLIPFAVQVALDVVQSPDETFDHLNLVFFTDLVTDWMTDPAFSTSLSLRFCPLTIWPPNSRLQYLSNRRIVITKLRQLRAKAP